MKPGKADMVRICVFLLFLLATVPAYCQRGNLDLNAGQTSDQFGALAPVTSPVLDLTGELTIIKPSQKNGGPSIVAGGEVRVPTEVTVKNAPWPRMPRRGLAASRVTRRK